MQIILQRGLKRKRKGKRIIRITRTIRKTMGKNTIKNTKTRIPEESQEAHQEEDRVIT